MIPQLWTRELDFVEWRKLHPDLQDREAEYLFRAELKMFRNYQDEIVNQMRVRQARLSGDLMNLAADISSVLNIKGGVKEEAPTEEAPTFFLLQENSSFILQENGSKIVL
jgi:hypothetical protein